MAFSMFSSTLNEVKAVRVAISVGNDPYNSFVDRVTSCRLLSKPSSVWILPDNEFVSNFNLTRLVRVFRGGISPVSVLDPISTPINPDKCPNVLGMAPFN